MELFEFFQPDFIDGFTKFLRDVEAVENIEGGGQHGGDDVEVGFPHVRADDLDAGGSRGSEGFEEARQGLGRAVLDHA